MGIKTALKSLLTPRLSISEALRADLGDLARDTAKALEQVEGRRWMYGGGRANGKNAAAKFLVGETGAELVRPDPANTRSPERWRASTRTLTGAVLVQINQKAKIIHCCQPQ